MLPTLVAEESLREAERVAVGTGGFEKADSQKIIDRWQRDATRDAKAARAKVAASPAILAGLGIGFHVQEKA